MKQIFTLVLATALSFTTAFAQSTSENFENVSNTTTLENRCWQFTGVGFQTAVNGSTIGNSNNLGAIGNSSLTTPYVNLVAGSVISFQFQLTTKLTGTSSARTMTVSLLTSSGTLTQVGTSVTLDKNTATNTAFTFSTPSPVTDTRKIVVMFTSGNNSSDIILMDNFNFGGELNYNSPYNCNTSSQSPLPIHLKSFQGLFVDEKAQLQWTVADNEAGSFFEIQKSTDAKEFKTIALLGTTDKRGDEIYTYNDAVGANAYYRLKLINKNGIAIYSDVLFIKKQGTANNTISLLQNPVKNTLKFTFTSEVNSQTEIAVYNMVGVKVFQSSFVATKGANTIAKTLDGQIKGGTYVLEVKNATNKSIAKFLKD